jgi:hypothetical protein
VAIQEGNGRMRRTLSKDENAVTHVIEFTIALTVFVLLVQAFTSSMNYRIGIDSDNNDERVVMAREVLSELTGSEGKIGNTTNWEDFEFGVGTTQLKDGTTVGLLNSNRELDKDKCAALQKFPYTQLRKELEVTQNLRIEVRTLVPDESVCLWGGDSSNSTISVKSEKYMLYNDGTTVLPAILTVTIFEGGNPSSKIYMTEIMYNPTNNGNQYEWIEVYNPNPFAIYITSWAIEDQDDSDLIVSNDDETLTIPGNNAGILTTSPTVFKETYVNYAYVFSVEDTAIGNGLGNSETITLSRGNYAESFSYSTSDGANGNGKSLTRSCYNCEAWNEAVTSPGTV